jgi:hypothetical protein
VAPNNNPGQEMHMSLTATFHSLPLMGLSSAPALPRPRAHAEPEDPALSQMTDLRSAACVVADPLDSLAQTLHVMQRARVHMALVTGVDGRMIGMVSRDDLHGERPVQRALADGIAYPDLPLERLMTPLSQWLVVSIDSIEHASLGDVVATLRNHSLRYLLVVAHEGDQPMLRGLFSARHLEAVLDTAIEADLHSRNFAELEALLAH